MHVIICIFVTAFRSLLGNWWNCFGFLARFCHGKGDRTSSHWAA